MFNVFVKTGVFFRGRPFVKSIRVASSRFICESPGRLFNTTTTTASVKYQTMDDIKSGLVQILEGHIRKEGSKSGEDLSKYLPKSQSELPVRKMKDSFDSAIVPLKTNTQLRDKYTTFLGGVRLGRLMEDIDLFAVWCCTKHITDINGRPASPFPYVIVTIRIDDIDLLDPFALERAPESGQGAFVNGTSGKGLTSRGRDAARMYNPNHDIRLSGHVSWVGTSSMEVAIWLDQETNESWRPITRALLLMAARNSTNSGPGIVNGIEAETPEEKELLAGAEKRKNQRVKSMKESLLKKVPTQEEFSLIHSLFIKTTDSSDLFPEGKILPPNGRWMHEATLSNLVFCHPEHRNLHNKIFGGFLIRQALELSWSVGYIYGMHVPKLVHISDIAFYSPVDVGSLLKLYASVTYTENEYIQVWVYAEAHVPLSHHKKSTTAFNFTYKLNKPADSLYPQTYVEAMKYIDGRRHMSAVRNFDRNALSLRPPESVTV